MNDNYIQQDFLTKMNNIIEQERQRLLQIFRKDETPLSETDRVWLRDELTVLHETLLSKHTLFADVKLLFENPRAMTAYGHHETKHPNVFSVDVELTPLKDKRVGLSVYITIRTKSAEVIRIVQEMYEQVGMTPVLERRQWYIDHEEDMDIRLHTQNGNLSTTTNETSLQ
jgi:hypothetical protein